MAKKCPTHPDRNVWSKGMCLECYRRNYAKPLKKTPINPISTKQKNILSAYRLLRKRYIQQFPKCQIKHIGCTIISTDIHHSGKKTTETAWLDVSKFISCCRNCHQKVENSPALARALDIYNYTPFLDEKDNFNDRLSDDDRIF